MKRIWRLIIILIVLSDIELYAEPIYKGVSMCMTASEFVDSIMPKYSYCEEVGRIDDTTFYYTPMLGCPSAIVIVHEYNSEVSFIQIIEYSNWIRRKKVKKELRDILTDFVWGVQPITFGEWIYCYNLEGFYVIEDLSEDIENVFIFPKD